MVGDTYKSQLLTHITSVNYLNSNWNGTYHSFLTNWLDKLCQWEAVTPVVEHYNGSNKIKLLQTAFVSKSIDLVKDDLQKEVALGRPRPTWDQYVILITNMAVCMDNQNIVSGSARQQ